MTNARDLNDQSRRKPSRADDRKRPQAGDLEDSSNDLSRELPGLPFATVPRGPDDDSRNAIERF